MAAQDEAGSEAILGWQAEDRQAEDRDPARVAEWSRRGRVVVHAAMGNDATLSGCMQLHLRLRYPPVLPSMTKPGSAPGSSAVRTGPAPLDWRYGGSDAELPDRVSTRLGEAGAKGTS
jgi:hypothetical protein